MHPMVLEDSAPHIKCKQGKTGATVHLFPITVFVDQRHHYLVNTRHISAVLVLIHYYYCHYHLMFHQYNIKVH